MTFANNFFNSLKLRRIVERHIKLSEADFAAASVTRETFKTPMSPVRRETNRLTSGSWRSAQSDEVCSVYLYILIDLHFVKLSHFVLRLRSVQCACSQYEYKVIVTGL